MHELCCTPRRRRGPRPVHVRLRRADQALSRDLAVIIDVHRYKGIPEIKAALVE